MDGLPVTTDVSVLILDIDGVVGAGRVWSQNEARRWTSPAGWLDPVLIARLNRLVRQSGAAVVLSTAWRNILGTASTADVLRACGFTGEVIGATPDQRTPEMVAAHERAPRWPEIRAWLDANPHVTRWAVLDDDEIDRVPTDRFVRTNAVHGLTDADVDRAVAILRGGG